MLSTGIIRKIDTLGRLTLPKELRDLFGIDPGTSLEVYTDDNTIILKKHNPCDVFTGELSADMVHYGGYNVSKDSIRELARIAGMAVIE